MSFDRKDTIKVLKVQRLVGCETFLWSQPYSRQWCPASSNFNANTCCENYIFEKGLHCYTESSWSCEKHVPCTYFWRAVPRRALGGDEATRRQVTTASKVRDLCIDERAGSQWEDQNVVGFEVTIHDAVMMKNNLKPSATWKWCKGVAYYAGLRDVYNETDMKEWWTLLPRLTLRIWARYKHRSVEIISWMIPALRSNVECNDLKVFHCETTYWASPKALVPGQRYNANRDIRQSGLWHWDDVIWQETWPLVRDVHEDLTRSADGRSWKRNKYLRKVSINHLICHLINQ